MKPRGKISLLLGNKQHLQRYGVKTADYDKKLLTTLNNII
jgi:hypothetical protein